MDKGSLFTKTSEIFRKVQGTLEGLGEDGLPLGEMEVTLSDIKSLSKSDVKTSADVFTYIGLKQMETFVNRLIRDRFAPLTSIILYFVYQELMELIHEPKGIREILTHLIYLLDRYKVDPNWCLYEQTLVLIDAINEVSSHLPQNKQLRDLISTVNSWKNSTPCVLPSKLSTNEILSTLKIEDTNNFERLLFLLWRLLEKAREKSKSKLHSITPQIFTDPDTFLQYIELLIKYIHDFCVQELKLPLVDIPIQLRVVYGEESKFTDAIAYFYRQGDNRFVVIHLPTGEKEIYLSEYAHLIIHEGIPGHATCDYLLSLLSTIKPLDYATSLDITAPFSFVDCASIFHEGWAVISQYIVSKHLRESFPALWYSWFNELHLYVTRVLQVLGYLKRTPREIIRSIRPYQLVSYFLGFLAYKTIYDIDPKGLLKSVMGGVFPVLPNLFGSHQFERKFLSSLNELIKEVNDFLRE